MIWRVVKFLILIIAVVFLVLLMLLNGEDA